MDGNLLRSSQATELLNVSPRTLEAWRQKGIGPLYITYSSRCIRYSEQVLREWLASCSRLNGAQAPKSQHK
jgi:DNA-binding transcriptional MerR regulator